VDFYCHELKLVIELDGEHHNSGIQKERDENRKAELERFGIRELRYSNDEVINNLETVLSSIALKCRQIKEKQNLFGKA
ncbi:MAG: endonuclease domain-containing protein, partial [Bacteroidales bacterium]|nr:endonuclease domain-containing protein [Bacteroidales bacterium]